MADASTTAPKQQGSQQIRHPKDDWWVAAAKQARDMAGRQCVATAVTVLKLRTRKGVRNHYQRDRVSHFAERWCRMRFKALVAVGNKKNKVGVVAAKGGDVTAVKKPRSCAKIWLLSAWMKKPFVTKVEDKTTGAHVLMKPAAPGTGIIAGWYRSSIIESWLA